VLSFDQPAELQNQLKTVQRSPPHRATLTDDARLHAGRSVDLWVAADHRDPRQA